MTLGGRRGLSVAGLAVETGEAVAHTAFIIAQTSATTIPASLITEAANDVSSSRTLLQLASGPTVASITETSCVFIGVPGDIVLSIGLESEDPFWETGAPTVAVIVAPGALACQAVVAREAGAGAGGAVTNPLVGALCGMMHVICTYNELADPCSGGGACS